MKSNLFLCGAGNAEGVRLALRINEKENRWENIFILDDDPAKKGMRILDVEILGGFDLLKNADPEKSEVVNLVARTTQKRMSAFERIAGFKVPFVPLIDPGVDLWGVEYDGDVIIYPNVTFSAGAFIDHGSVAFTGAVIGHGCHVGKFCVIAPGAVLNARIHVDDGVYIGTNASILPDLRIGCWSTIGLNSGVVQDVPPEVTVMGVPAEIILDQKHAVTDMNEAEIGKESTSVPDETKSGLETALTGIWCELLNLNAIGINDNFFEHGGNSLLAVRMHKVLKEKIYKNITVIDIFRYPTIRSLIGFLHDKVDTLKVFNIEQESKHVKMFRERISRTRMKGNKNLSDSDINDID